MARIATTEDVEGLREEEDVGDERGQPSDADGSIDETEPKESQVTGNATKKYIATIQEVHEAFDSVNTLRYSQPTHLQGDG